MANLEVQIGADSSELNSEISAAEAKIKRLGDLKVKRTKLGLDTKELNADIADAKTKLKGLQDSVKATGDAFNKSAPKVANAGNTLTNFSRIAQDAPFGIMGIGNNITATAEAFSSLSKQSGGAVNALKAVGSSLMGGGGVLLAISLVTTGLTIMSQQGLTVGDVFNKLTGNFDNFKKALSDVNAESAKQSGEQIATMNAYVKVAQNGRIADEDRLIAVKKLQDEYPKYFGNLTKEQILNGDVTLAVKELTKALIAKAKAQGFANKIGEIAEKQVPLREKEAKLLEEGNKAIAERKRLEDKLASAQFNEATFKALERQRIIIRGIKSDYADVQKQLRANNLETSKWEDGLNRVVEAGMGLDFDPEPVKKPKKPKKVKKAKAKRDTSGIDLSDELAAERKRALSLIGSEEDQELPFIVPVADEQFKAMLASMRAFDEEAKGIITGSIADTFGQLGTAIGESLVSGGNVLLSIGQTILQGLGNFLSEMGGMLIKYGTLAVVKGQLDLAIATGGPVSIAAGLAAIGVGVALKATGGAIGSLAKGGGSKGSISAGNSVSSPVSSVASASGSSNFQNVVFEISGQSLVGVLSNTLNKNIKLGGVPAI